MPEMDHGPPLSRCVVDQWLLRERLESLLYATNTLSGILSLLECNDESRSTSQVLKRIARNAFGADPDTFSAISYGSIQEKLRSLSAEFTLIDSYKETRPPTKGRGGRIRETEVEVFEKDPRGYWFGDPFAARTLSVCADLELSPIDVFTSAEKKGETRAPVTTVLILKFLHQSGVATQKELIRDCFWTPADRDEYQILYTRVNKNIQRLEDSGLVTSEFNEEAVYSHAGTELDTYPRDSSGHRVISETDRILAYLYGHEEVHRQELLDHVQTNHASRILNHLMDEGVVERIQGGMENRTEITLTGSGKSVVKQLIIPLFQAIAPEGSLEYDSKAEYERKWLSTPTVNEDYLTGRFRSTLRDYVEYEDRYQRDAAVVSRIDQERNPWR